jgi:diaminopimelate epimerase
VAEYKGRKLEFTAVSVGNPHAVTFEAGLSVVEIDELAPRVSAMFAAGANIEFATALATGGYDTIVWERGVGRTLACGTGAAATAVAARHRGGAVGRGEVVVQLPGGPLSIGIVDAVAGDGVGVTVSARGPAALVFRGEIVDP